MVENLKGLTETNILASINIHKLRPKMSYNIGPCCKCYKTFFGHNLQMFVIN